MHTRGREQSRVALCPFSALPAYAHPLACRFAPSLQVGAFREFMRITRRCAEPVAFSFSAPLHREQVGGAVTLCALLPLALLLMNRSWSPCVVRAISHHHCPPLLPTCSWTSCGSTRWPPPSPLARCPAATPLQCSTAPPLRHVTACCCSRWGRCWGGVPETTHASWLCCTVRGLKL